jgi:polyisoprenoid-binding protein YceI
MNSEKQVITATKWNIDKTHSEIAFSAKHLMITTVRGVFTDYEAEVETEGEDFTTAKIRFTAKTASANSGNEQRDAHIRGEDFFASARFPTLQFVSTAVTKKSEDTYTLQGNITIRDVTKPITLNVEYGGTAKDPWGGYRAGFTVTGKLSRREFGLTWNVLTEAGMLVSDEIKINCSVQLVKAV